VIATERCRIRVPDRQRYGEQADPRAGTTAGHEHADLPCKALHDHLGEQLSDDVCRRNPKDCAAVERSDRVLDHEGREATVEDRRTAHLHMTPRAGIVVTGTEVLTGRVTDRNGPWLAERLKELGVGVAYTTIVGDRPGDMEDVLRFMAGEGLDLILTSGGLGAPAGDLHAGGGWGAQRVRV